MGMYRYHLLGWSANDALVLKSLLSLMESRLQDQWDESHSVADAALVLIDVSTPENTALYTQLVKQHADKWILPYGTALEGIPLYLGKPVRAPGNSTGLLYVLAHLPSRQSSTNIHTNEIKSHTTDSRIVPIWDALNQRKSFALYFESDIDKNTPALIVDGPERYCYALDRPNRWLPRFEGKIEWLELSTEALNTAKNKAKYHTYPLSSIRWCLALLLWIDNPSPRAAQFQRVKLQRWPDFTLLPYRPQHVIMSGCLSKGAMTLDAVATAVKQPRGLVQNFVNACAETGLLDEKEMISVATTSPTAVAATTVPIIKRTGKSSLFAAFLSKLGGGKG